MNTIRVVHNHAGNCINFFNSTQPVFWNGCLNAVSTGTTDRINIENNIRDVGWVVVSTSSSEFHILSLLMRIMSVLMTIVDYINDAAILSVKLVDLF